jgi:hypothetical protein
LNTDISTTAMTSQSSKFFVRLFKRYLVLTANPVSVCIFPCARAEHKPIACFTRWV